MFTIEIKTSQVEQVVLPKEWRRVSDKESGGYDWTPEAVSAKQVERVIYQQSVEELNLADVIKAVNKIK